MIAVETVDDFLCEYALVFDRIVCKSVDKKLYEKELKVRKRKTWKSISCRKKVLLDIILK